MHSKIDQSSEKLSNTLTSDITSKYNFCIRIKWFVRFSYWYFIPERNYKLLIIAVCFRTRTGLMSLESFMRFIVCEIFNEINLDKSLTRSFTFPNSYQFKFYEHRETWQERPIAYLKTPLDFLFSGKWLQRKQRHNATKWILSITGCRHELFFIREFYIEMNCPNQNSEYNNRNDFIV